MWQRAGPENRRLMALTFNMAAATLTLCVSVVMVRRCIEAGQCRAVPNETNWNFSDRNYLLWLTQCCEHPITHFPLNPNLLPDHLLI